MHDEQREAVETFKLVVHVRMEYATYDEIQGGALISHTIVKGEFRLSLVFKFWKFKKK